MPVPGPLPGGARTAAPTGWMTAAREFWRLPPHRLQHLVHAACQVDQVEVKVLVSAADHEAVCTAIGADLDRAPRRQVYYLDTQDRALERLGVVVRLRSIEHRPDDAVVKLRPLTPGAVPAWLRRDRHFAVELDAMPGHYVRSGVLKRRLEDGEVAHAVEGRGVLHRLLSPAQRRLLGADDRAHLDLDRLGAAGPVDVRKCRLPADGLPGALVLERWSYPDGSRLLELSTRCPGHRMMLTAARLGTLLRHHGIDVAGPQQTKTRRTLDAFRRVHAG
jgi:hypothetical protein